MRIKIDKNLQNVAESAGTDVKDMSLLMVNALLAAGLIKDDSEYFGCSIRDCNGDTGVYTICSVIHQIGVRKITDTIYDAFAACVIMGDGNCPECGGDFKFVETIGHELNDGDYLTPNSYIVDEYVYRCPICGKETKTEKEL